MRLLTEEEIAGVCGRFAKSENKKEGLHLLAEMAADAEHKETLKAVGKAINDYAHNKISFERLAELLEINFCEPSMLKIRARVKSGVTNIPGVLISRKYIPSARLRGG